MPLYGHGIECEDDVSLFVLAERGKALADDRLSMLWLYKEKCRAQNIAELRIHVVNELQSNARSLKFPLRAVTVPVILIPKCLQ